MTDKGKFLVYCAEIYKDNKGLSGKELSQLFNKYNIWNFILNVTKLYILLENYV